MGSVENWNGSILGLAFIVALLGGVFGFIGDKCDQWRWNRRKAREACEGENDLPEPS